MIEQSKSLLDSIKKENKSKTEIDLLRLENQRIVKENQDMNSKYGEIVKELDEK